MRANILCSKLPDGVSIVAPELASMLCNWRALSNGLARSSLECGSSSYRLSLAHVLSEPKPEGGDNYRLSSSTRCTFAV